MYNGHVGHKLHMADWSKSFDFLNLVWDFGPSVGEGGVGVGSDLVGFARRSCISYSS